MTNFTGLQDFYGTYAGSYDGRRAQLIISDLKDDSVAFLMHIALTDLDRNETYVGTFNAGTEPTHVLHDIALTNNQGGSMTWSRLLVHTWDTRFLSGESTWNGTEYGMSFTRQ